MAKVTPVNMKANIADFHRIEKRIAQAVMEIDADKSLTEEEAAKCFEAILNHYTGPATGLVWDSDTNTISIAPGFHADAEGNVVRD